MVAFIHARMRSTSRHYHTPSIAHNGTVMLCASAGLFDTLPLFAKAQGDDIMRINGE